MKIYSQDPTSIAQRPKNTGKCNDLTPQAAGLKLLIYTRENKRAINNNKSGQTQVDLQDSGISANLYGALVLCRKKKQNSKLPKNRYRLSV